MAGGLPSQDRGFLVGLTLTLVCEWNEDLFSKGNSNSFCLDLYGEHVLCVDPS